MLSDTGVVWCCFYAERRLLSSTLLQPQEMQDEAFKEGKVDVVRRIKVKKNSTE